METSSKEKKNTWEGIGQILSGIAALITALLAVYIFFNQKEPKTPVVENKPRPDTTKQFEDTSNNLPNRKPTSKSNTDIENEKGSTDSIIFPYNVEKKEEPIVFKLNGINFTEENLKINIGGIIKEISKNKDIEISNSEFDKIINRYQMNIPVLLISKSQEIDSIRIPTQEFIDLKTITF